jgi:small subunit ribosomal protein S20
MPIIKSAKKRVRVSTKAAVRNSKTKRSLKGALKAFHAAVTGGSKDARKAESKAHSALDTAAKKGLMHKNKVARKKSQLARAAKATAAAPVKKTAVKKTVAKKPAAKKAVAKKTTTKKK